ARPFELVKARQKCRPEGASEMAAPRTPIEATPAERAAVPREGGELDAEGGDEARPLARETQLALAELEQPAACEAVEELHAELAGKMVVADARMAQGRVLGSGARAQLAGAGGEPHQPLEHGGDIRARQVEIAVPALLLDREQAARRELGEMGACRRQAHSGLRRELACREGTSAQQGREHVGARRVAHEGGEGGDLRAGLHSSIL